MTRLKASALTLFCSRFGEITAKKAAVAHDVQASDKLAHPVPSAEAAEPAAQSVRGKEAPRDQENDADSNPKEKDETLPDPHDKYDKKDIDKFDPSHAPRPEEPNKKPANHKMADGGAGIIDEAAKAEEPHVDSPAGHETHETAKKLQPDNPTAHEEHETAGKLQADNPTASHKAHKPAENVLADGSAGHEEQETAGKPHANNLAGHKAQETAEKSHANSAGQLQSTPLEKSADSVGQLDLAAVEGKPDKEDEVGKISPNGGADEKDKTTKVKGDDTIDREEAAFSEALHKEFPHNVTPLNLDDEVEVPKNKRPLFSVQKLEGEGGSQTSTAASLDLIETPSNETANMTADLMGNATGNGTIATADPDVMQKIKETTTQKTGNAAPTTLASVLSYVLAFGSVVRYFKKFGLHT